MTADREIFIHPKMQRFVTEQAQDATSRGEKALQAGAALTIAGTMTMQTIAPVSATETTSNIGADASGGESESGKIVSYVVDKPDDEMGLQIASDTVSFVGGLGDVVDPTFRIPKTASTSGPQPDDIPANNAEFVAFKALAQRQDGIIERIAGIEPVFVSGKSPNEAGVEPNIAPISPAEGLNGALASIDISRPGAISADAVKTAATNLDRLLAPTDTTRPDDLPDGVIKLYIHNEAAGILVPYTVAQKTAKIERFSTAETVTFVYIAAEIYQQLVETEFPQHSGSMLRIRDLNSPYHAKHIGGDVDISSSLGPTVDQYSDGPIMDKTSPNYDEEFTIRFFEEIARIEIDGSRLVKQVVFEDRNIINFLDETIDPSYGGFAVWHAEHANISINTSGVTYRVDPNDMPWGNDKDLLINSDVIPLTDEENALQHGEFLEFVASGAFPVGSARSKLYDGPPTETVLRVTKKDTASKNYSPGIYLEANPVITDVQQTDEAGYRQLVADASLPDPYEYGYFGTGEPVSVERGIELTKELQARGYDSDWGESQLMRLTPGEYFDMYRLAGFPLYDIPNLIGMTRGESMYYAQIIGDHGRGGSVGAGQQLEQYLLDPSKRSFIDMFNPWINILETKAKYIENWQIHGFDKRLKSWNAVNDNTEGFQAGVVDGQIELQRYLDQTQEAA